MQERHAGGTYALDDFVQAMTDVDADVGNWLRRILHEPDLPGFLASDASVARLPEDDAGNPRYQTLVHVRNDEAAPGVAGLSYRPEDGFFQWSPFVQVPGNSFSGSRRGERRAAGGSAPGDLPLPKPPHHALARGTT